MKSSLFLLLATLFISFEASAAIIAGNKRGQSYQAPPANNTAPSGSETEWNRVGMLGDGTAVYLGDGWILTANHVSGSSFVVGSESYSIVAGTSDQIGSADLKVMRIDLTGGSSLETLGSVTLASNGLSVNTLGTQIGTGQTSTGQNDSYVTWTWDDAAEREKNWNYQHVSSTGTTLGNTATFATSFENIEGYGAAVNHDSGSTYFVGDTLYGIAIGAAFGDIDGTTKFTPYGNDRSVYADISAYSDLITAAIPEPATLSIFGSGIFALIGYRRRYEWLDRLKQLFNRKDPLEPQAKILRSESGSYLGSLLLKLFPVRPETPPLDSKADPLGDLIIKLDGLVRRKDAIDPQAKAPRSESGSHLGSLLLKLVPVRPETPPLASKADPVGDLIMKIDGRFRRQ